MITVAIDGPAGAGKSTVARAVANALGLRYLDTGAMYRAVALAALDRGVDPRDGTRVASLARDLDLDVSGDMVRLDGVDVSERIRGRAVTDAVSIVAAHPEVRAALVERQRRLGSAAGVVMEGRDIGTAVLPDAPVKVFLVADLDERAARRSAQLGLAGDREGLARLRADLAERDQADSTRAASPLARAPDAVVIDTTDRTVDDVVREIVDLARSGAGA